MPLNKLSLDRQAQIVDLINNLKLSLGLSYPEDDLKKIIRSAIPEVLIKEDDFNGNYHIKGAVFRKSNEYSQPVIAVQSKQSRQSKTFTLAHEFAHYILNHNPAHNYYIDDRQFDGTKVMQDEGEANFFAMELLMPKAVFENLDLPFVSNNKLAAYFGVSETSVGVRREWLKRNGY